MFTSITYTRPNHYYDGAHGEVTLRHGEKVVYSYQIFGDIFTARECYLRLTIIQRLYEQSLTAGDAAAIAQLRTKEAFDIWYHPVWPIGDDYADNERPEWYPVPEVECEGEDIISDFLTESYSRAFGLVCGADVSEDDLFAFWQENFEAKKTMPEYLQDAADRHEAEITELMTQAVKNTYSRWFSLPVSY